MQLLLKKCYKIDFFVYIKIGKYEYLKERSRRDISYLKEDIIEMYKLMIDKEDIIYELQTDIEYLLTIKLN